MDRKEIEENLEQIKDYVESLNTFEVGQGIYSDEEIFGRNITDLFYDENGDERNPENLNEEVNRMIENAIDFITQWYQEEFSDYKVVTLEEILGSSKSAKKLEDYMLGNNQEKTADLEDTKRMLELEGMEEAEMRQYYESEDAHNSPQEETAKNDEIGDEKNLDDLSMEELEERLKKEKERNNSKKQKLEKVKRIELINKIKQAQQEGAVLDAELRRVQDNAKDK